MHCCSILALCDILMTFLSCVVLALFLHLVAPARWAGAPRCKDHARTAQEQCQICQQTADVAGRLPRLPLECILGCPFVCVSGHGPRILVSRPYRLTPSFLHTDFGPTGNRRFLGGGLGGLGGRENQFQMVGVVALFWQGFRAAWAAQAADNPRDGR